MHPWVNSITEVLTPLSNDRNAAVMSAYMRNHFAFLGIQSGPRREATRHLFQKHHLPPVEALPDVLAQLWELTYREYQMVGVDLLVKLKTQLPISMCSDLERCITYKSWWDTVDLLATHVAGSFYTRFSDAFEPYLIRWQASENLWLRRTTLLYQLKYKDKTDSARLFNLIRYNRTHPDFFIQKAIGWALREYSKISPEKVMQFIRDENLNGLAAREGTKWLRAHGQTSHVQT